MQTDILTNQTNPVSDSLQNKENMGYVTINSYWETGSRTERAELLEGLFISEKPKVDAGTTEGRTNEVESRIFDNRVAPEIKISPPAKRINEDYQQILRGHYMKIILQSVQSVQSYAGTSSASVYIHKILHTIRDFDEKSPDDLILEVLFAFYDALAYQNQWTTYTSLQFEKAWEVLNRVTKESIKSKDVEKAIAALDNAGFDTIPFQFSLEDDDAT